MSTDRVLTINDYYDGPRLGVAELNGIPHIYESEFDHNTDEYGDTYFLSPIGKELLSAVLEDWEIWLRWEAARKRGEVEAETHPALPSERARHEELKVFVGTKLQADPVARKRYRASFLVPPGSQGSWQGMLVQWVAA
ncbi:hypothetical protein [Ideonella oryzae]|uniref:Uncharacterized protein n=1 Tax=Ideonella oryzae TaxID=2937441 RepID=A0ABT1BR27_9BURK|nr:hypothetical protein [Ideonella oryzae]MCO5978678.1 hypothetical protein [Ideonella oryzae]